jgi:Uma2 family endonuclease
MVEKIAGMTLDDFIRLYDEEGPFELIDGERVHMSPNVIKHNLTGKRLLSAFLQYEQTHQAGEVFYETPFVLTFTPNWVTGSRVPDLMFVTSARMEQYRGDNPSWEEMPLVLAPDLVVEIVSPTDRFADVLLKAERYLADGVKVVWLVDSESKVVLVLTANHADDKTLMIDDTLDGGDLLPDFAIALRDLFA